MGYQIQEREPFIIKGRDGKEYKIPRINSLNIDEFAIVVRYTEAEDVVEKIKICKEFLLTIAPELEDEQIGDVEYFTIFQAYDKPANEKQKKSLGE